MFNHQFIATIYTFAYRFGYFKVYIYQIGRGLLIADGNRWLRSRRLLTPAFHYDILRPYVKVYAETVDELVGLWKKVPEGESVDVVPYISQLSLDIMLRCICSFRSNCQIKYVG